MDTPKHDNAYSSQHSIVENRRKRTRWLVITAILAAISIVLSLTPLGFIPVPTPAGNATILQIPTILAAIFEGPAAGGIVGAVFGVSSLLHSSVVWFKNPLVSVLPRILIGLISYLVYRSMSRGKGTGFRIFAFVVTGFVGSAVNTILVLGAVYIFFPVKLAALASIAGVQGGPEAVVSAIMTAAIASAYLGVSRAGRKSRIS